MRKNLFITGATGCVGHYVVEQFANHPDYWLYLLVQDPSKLRFDIAKVANATLLRGYFQDVLVYRELLAEMDHVIHVATSWGGKMLIRPELVMQFLDCLDMQRIGKLILFSTASILGHDHAPLEAAASYGTPYIQAKYHSYLQVKKSKFNPKTIHLFPTLVIGGDRGHRYSHAARWMQRLRKHYFWLSHLDAPFGFHWIHARDVARIVRYLIEHTVCGQEFVLGNEYLEIKDFIQAAGRYYRKKPSARLPISVGMLTCAIRLLGIKIDPWDRFSLNYQHFHYQTVHCRTFALPTRCFSVEQMLAEMDAGR